MDNFYYFRYLKTPNLFYRYGKDYEYIWKIDEVKENDVIYAALKQEIGGAAGGSCWGDEAHRYTTVPEFGKDKLILELAKNIIPELLDLSYLRVMQLTDLIETFNYHNTEYYGNYTEYRVFCIKIKKTKDGWEIVEEC